MSNSNAAKSIAALLRLPSPPQMRNLPRRLIGTTSASRLFPLRRTDFRSSVRFGIFTVTCFFAIKSGKSPPVLPAGGDAYLLGYTTFRRMVDARLPPRLNPVQ